MPTFSQNHATFTSISYSTIKWLLNHLSIWLMFSELLLPSAINQCTEFMMQLSFFEDIMYLMSYPDRFIWVTNSEHYCQGLEKLVTFLYAALTCSFILFFSSCRTISFTYTGQNSPHKSLQNRQTNASAKSLLELPESWCKRWLGGRICYNVVQSSRSRSHAKAFSTKISRKRSQ